MNKPFVKEMLTRYWFNATLAVMFVLTIIVLTMCSHCSKPEGMSREESEKYASEAWQKALAQRSEQLKPMWENRVIKAGEWSMPFDVKVYGKKPEDGRSLYISIHGGGNTTPEMNNQQWENQKRLYTPAEGVYIAPRAAVDDWNMWFRPHVDTLFAQIIQGAVAFHDVNPNKVYLVGYSAGGDGVYRMAPRMADYWAASSMMAGHPGEASAVNLRNIGFMVWMGEHDAAYNRNRLAAEYGAMMDSLEQSEPANYNPKGYAHKTTIVEGCGHWMNRADTAAIEWINDFERNPRPEYIVWRQEESGLRDCFYNLSVPKEEMAAGKEARVSFHKNVITIVHNDYNTLNIHLNDQIVDLNKKVSILYNSTEIFNDYVPRKAEHIDASIEKRMDSEYIFNAVISIVNGETRAL